MTAKEELTWGFPFVEHTLDIVSQYQGEKEEKKIKTEEEEHKEGGKKGEKREMWSWQRKSHPKTKGIQSLITEEKKQLSQAFCPICSS